ncbi:ligand-binding protein SH3 [Methanofollis formosanus]|uniref:Ligand-binding protein SH3 n=1 Tax=Methanofollis formosanus TaxID=299308 RepID=A0A8G1A3V0_9EURY|nr:small multi-drug export protein [Methanofollis formosanus]QYZ79929.1 ligand-binding protein SH3 [Methanofollis formosanus]
MDLIATVLIAVQSALPFWESRYAIPLAIQGGYPPVAAAAIGIASNLAVVVVLLLLLEPVSDFLIARSKLFEKFFDWLFTRTRRHSERFERWGALALIPFVAVPIPVTGSWTACAAAFVFGIRFRYALPAIAAGMLIAVAVTTITMLGITSVHGMLG